MANNLLGKTFGLWKVIKKSDKKVGVSGAIYWECKCKCGNTKIIRSTELRRGRSTSCGCYGLEPWRASFNEVLWVYKNRCKTKEREWNLTDDEALELFRSDCYYCGIEPKQAKRSHSHKEPFLYNGIDRIDSDKGYTTDNALPCCGTCNSMKSDRTQKEFLNQIKNIYVHLNQKDD